MVNFKCRECNEKIYPNKQSLSIIVMSKKDTPRCAILLFCDEQCMTIYKGYALLDEVVHPDFNVQVYKRRWFPKLLRKIEREFCNATRNTD